MAWSRRPRCRGWFDAATISPSRWAARAGAAERALSAVDGAFVRTGFRIVAGTRPLVVIEGRGAQAADRLDEVLARARDDGWRVLHGWGAPMRRDRVVCTGWVRSSDDARRALLAAVAGSGLAVIAATDRETTDRFLDDLRRLGSVEHETPGATDGSGSSAD